MRISKLDQVYRSVVLTKFFSQGWGSPQNLKRLLAFRKLLANRETCQTLVEPNHPIYITGNKEDHGDYEILNGHLISPFNQHLPDLMPKPSEKAQFQLVLPKRWQTSDKPICLQMAGTGDHQFWRRRQLIARPLCREHGVASLLLENPFYGSRKPKEQNRSQLRNVSDICVMGASLVLESIALFRWLEKEGFGPFCLHGISMGGHMASLAATSWNKPIALAPCLSWTTASGVFTQGVMSADIDWKCLENQYFSDQFYNIEEFMKIYNSESDVVAQKEALKFMGTFMNEVTHIKNFSKPIDTELIVVVTARDDGYVPRSGTKPITEIWPGCDVRYVECGHVSAYLLHQTAFRKAIMDSINLSREKYNLDGTVRTPIAAAAAAGNNSNSSMNIGSNPNDLGVHL